MRPLIAICCSYASPEGSAASGTDTVPHAYGRCVTQSGGVPVLVPCMEEPAVVGDLLDRVEGIIITGGVDVDPALYGQEPLRALGKISPERDAQDRAIMEWVLERPEVPVLGICRGIQAMNVFAGGSLHQDIPSCTGSRLQHSQQAPAWYGTHEVEIQPDCELWRALGATTIRANSFHHQAVDAVAPGFRVVARASDGVVEAIEREHARFCLGVQFHPELMAERSEPMMGLFRHLVAAASVG